MPRKRSAPPLEERPSKRVALHQSASTLNDTHKKSKPTTKPKLSKTPNIINHAPTKPLNIYVFGSNENGELALGPSAGSDDVPCPRLNPHLAGNVVQIAVGGMHCAALTRDNRVLTWGVNDLGALGRDTSWDGGMVDMDAEQDGDGDVNPRESVPGEVDVPKGVVFTWVVAADNATFRVTETGDVYGWGTMRANDGLTCFQEGTGIQKSPIVIPALKRVTKIAAGNNHVVALTAEGVVYTWGFGEQGQLGRRLPDPGRLHGLRPHDHKRKRLYGLMPHKLGLRNIVNIGVGADHSFAMNKDGKVYAWGLNNYGQTGIFNNAGEDSANISVPTLVTSLDGKGTFTSIVGGNKHTIAMTSAGKCFAWGQLDAFAIGLKLDTLQSDDVVRDERGNPRMLIAPLWLPQLDVSFVAAGGDHSIALTRDHKAFSWGFNNSHQTGHKDNGDIEVPTLLDNVAIRGKAFVWAGAGGQFSLLAEEAMS